MVNERKAASDKRPDPEGRRNAQGEHEGSAQNPEEFDVMNPQKRGLGEGEPASRAEPSERRLSATPQAALSERGSQNGKVRHPESGGTSMSRNTMIIAGVAVVAIILLFVLFSGDGGDTPPPVAETEVPEATE